MSYEYSKCLLHIQTTFKVVRDVNSKFLVTLVVIVTLCSIPAVSLPFSLINFFASVSLVKSLEKVGLRSLGKSFLFEPREDFLSLRALLGGESLRFGLGIEPGPVAVSLGPPRPEWRAVAPSISVLER